MQVCELVYTFCFFLTSIFLVLNEYFILSQYTPVLISNFSFPPSVKDGTTALLKAANKGYNNVIEELLKFSPTLGILKVRPMEKFYPSPKETG